MGGESLRMMRPGIGADLTKYLESNSVPLPGDLPPGLSNYMYAGERMTNPVVNRELRYMGPWQITFALLRLAYPRY